MFQDGFCSGGGGGKSRYSEERENKIKRRKNGAREEKRNASSKDTLYRVNEFCMADFVCEIIMRVSE